VLRPTTKSVDASLLLARTVTPEPMRPGWPQALAMSHSVLPHRRMLSLDQRLAHAAARPVIVPETIVCDQGEVFISHNFRASCRMLGINFQPAHPGTPTDKPHIEKMMFAVGSLFAQFVAGYTGRAVEHRGRRVEDQPTASTPNCAGAYHRTTRSPRYGCTTCASWSATPRSRPAGQHPRPTAWGSRSSGGKINGFG
jgi:hypothetical protein